MNHKHPISLLLLVVLTCAISSCSLKVSRTGGEGSFNSAENTVETVQTSASVRNEHYVSCSIDGDSQRINLAEIKKAFESSRTSDHGVWTSSFEKRVNEIYKGKGTLSIDWEGEGEKIVVTGYIKKVDKSGFQPGDDKLFGIDYEEKFSQEKTPAVKAIRVQQRRSYKSPFGDALRRGWGN